MPFATCERRPPAATCPERRPPKSGRQLCWLCSAAFEAGLRISGGGVSPARKPREGAQPPHAPLGTNTSRNFWTQSNRSMDMLVWLLGALFGDPLTQRSCGTYRHPTFRSDDITNGPLGLGPCILTQEVNNDITNGPLGHGPCIVTQEVSNDIPTGITRLRAIQKMTQEVSDDITNGPLGLGPCIMTQEVNEDIANGPLGPGPCKV